MWAVDRLICVCNFQQICNFLICANLQFKKCKFAFFACKLVKIRECTLVVILKMLVPRKKIEERRLQPIQGLRSALAEDSGPVAGSVSGRELR